VDLPNVLSDPDVVYHYTSAATLLKIVESESIWATNLQYLNDITESTHCINTLRRRVTNFLARNPSDFGERLQSALESAGVSFEPPYVASFSAIQDSLPLWRSYCPNGNGVSIGFKMSALKRSALVIAPPKDSQYSDLKPVEYLDLDDFALQDRILRECLEEFSRYRRRRDTEPPDELAVALDDEYVLRLEIGDRSCLVKHSGFKTEREIRLIAPPLSLSGASLKFRCPRTTVIPYVEVFMPKRRNDDFRFVGNKLGLKDDYFIDCVVVGPTPNPELTVKAIQLLFESKQVVDATVLKSDIPYRDL
jgi:hypothetical protein